MKYHLEWPTELQALERKFLLKLKIWKKLHSSFTFFGFGSESIFFILVSNPARLTLSLSSMNLPFTQPSGSTLYLP
jgi:cellulose synthase/poly-beta-1,6-N-acetylglucosamine synthase-like glycosyltransferase